MKTVLIVLAVLLVLVAACTLRYLTLSESKKVFICRQIRALPHLLPRYFA